MEAVSRHFLLKLEAAFLFCSLLLGYVLYSDALGWGDALNFMSRPVSLDAFVHSWWLHQNGRIGQAMLTAMLLPLRWWSPTPEQFPWWLIESISFFCVTSVPTLMLLALPKSVRPSNRSQLFLLLFIFWGTWSFNHVTYETGAWFSAANFVAYAGPIFLISVALYFLARGGLSPSIAEHRWRPFLLVLFGSFVFALLGEQYLLAFPIFVIGVGLTGVARRTVNFYSVIRLGVFSSVGTLMGALVYWLAPGQQARNSHLALHIGNVWHVYEKSIHAGYQLLFLQSQQATGASLLVAVHTFFVAVAARWAWQDVSHTSSFPDSLRGAGVMLLTMLVAYHACFLTLMVSSYFPRYAGIFPALLLLMAFVIAGIILCRVMESLRFLTYRIRVISLLLVAGVSLTLTYHNVHADIRTAKLVDQNNMRREKVYQYVLREADHSNVKKFVLFNCPKAAPRHGWSMEPPWGLSAYFNWHGRPDIKVFLRGNYDFPKAWKKSGFKAVDCDEIFPIQSSSSRSSLSDTGHIISDRSWLVTTKAIQDWNGKGHLNKKGWKRASVIGLYGSTLLKLSGLPESSALWIRHNPIQEKTTDAYYRKRIHLEKSVSGDLRISGINRYRLFINGHLVGTGSKWTTLGRYQVHLKDGDIIAVHINTDHRGVDALLVDFRVG